MDKEEKEAARAEKTIEKAEIKAEKRAEKAAEEFVEKIALIELIGEYEMERIAAQAEKDSKGAEKIVAKTVADLNAVISETDQKAADSYLKKLENDVLRFEKKAVKSIRKTARNTRMSVEEIAKGLSVYFIKIVTERILSHSEYIAAAMGAPVKYVLDVVAGLFAGSRTMVECIALDVGKPESQVARDAARAIARDLVEKAGMHSAEDKAAEKEQEDGEETDD
ncbi:MAG: hypothetical protein LUE27_07275 [Clostridia bacterium]|nr:hypothetical protein [Clostridia bacterium]MCD8295025.1 hypothetical protein [Clostridia bacterium]